MRCWWGLLLSMSLLTVHAAEHEPWTLVRPGAIRAHVEFLSSDLLEGRAAATRGHDIAAAYVAAQFRQAGLAPDGDEGGYLQAVSLLEATPVLPGSSAEFVHDGETIRFEYGTHYLPAADFASASSTLSAPLVFAGYGVDAPELGHDDFANIELEGRIAVIFSGAPASFPHDRRAYHSWGLRKSAVLAERGAVGVITVDSPADAKRIPWERRVAMSWMPQMRWLDAHGVPQDTFPQLKLQFRFSQEAAARLFEHAAQSFEQALATAETGEVQSFELPGLLTLSATTGLRRTQSVNVVGTLAGTDPTLRNEYVVLTAHLDHLGRGAAVDGDAIYNGAHDNAVGVGILLEIAHALHASNVRPRRSVIFAAVTAEEKGLLGSDYLADRAQLEGRRLVANVNMDMPLPFVPVSDLLALGAEHSTLGQMARNAAANEGYRLGADESPEEVRFIRSDQFSFIRRGIPAIALKAGSRARDRELDVAALQQQFRSNHYHQPSDDLALPIDYETAADLARVELRILMEAAGATRPPRWKSGDFFGERFRRE